MSETKVPQNVLDCVYGSTEADWHQHSNGGGWVYKTAKVEASAYLHPTSIVSGNAEVSGNAQVSGNALVSGNAWVSGNAQVSGNALVSGNAWVYGNARVFGDAQVSGDAWVSGNAEVSGNAQVSGNALVSGNARVFGNAWVKSPPYLQASRHAITLCSLTQIAIGCHVHDIAYWLEHYKAIGRKEGYTKIEIAEYGSHLKYLAQWAEFYKKHYVEKAEAAKV